MTRLTRSSAAPLIALAVCVLSVVLLVIAAALVDDDALDTVFGFFTGMLSVAALACIALVVFRRRFHARRHDEEILDGIEPLGGRFPRDDSGNR